MTDLYTNAQKAQADYRQAAAEASRVLTRSLEEQLPQLAQVLKEHYPDSQVTLTDVPNFNETDTRLTVEVRLRFTKEK